MARKYVVDFFFWCMAYGRLNKAAALPGPLNGRKLGGPIVKRLKEVLRFSALLCTAASLHHSDYQRRLVQLAGRYLEGSTQLQIFATRHPTRPTKVDTLGTPNTLAGPKPVYVHPNANAPGRRRDLPPHLSALGVPSVSGLAPPIRQPSVAFGSRVPAASSTRTAFPSPSRETSSPSQAPRTSAIPTSRYSQLHPPSRARGGFGLPTTTHLSARRHSVTFANLSPVLSPIPERASDSGEMQSLMDSTHDSLNAETSHIELQRVSDSEILRHTFYKDDEASLEDKEESLSQSIAVITGKKTLDTQEIWDAGENRDPNSFRYRITGHLLVKQEQVVRDLQWFLIEASKLVEGRNRYFHVDPGDALLPILSGASDAQQIRVAWDLLCTRLELGEKFFNKYLLEAEGEGHSSASPTSTTSSLLQGYNMLTSAEQRMKHLTGIRFTTEDRLAFLRNGNLGLKEEMPTYLSIRRTSHIEGLGLENLGPMLRQ
ncbi:hypothetical protein C8F04DRAFT_1301318 [Mycena alexandri]|uniref:Uncharacterized protein n=1 Tax=Mycena alexandri TaxID=1745969 RepID=A0AAD6SCB7_9AGAR|nr:hypothetical protein C8F04DRAFT_1301318 [Mycena alexandri]